MTESPERPSRLARVLAVLRDVTQATITVSSVVLVLYVALVGPPLLVARTFGGDGLHVWAAVVTMEFLAGSVVTVVASALEKHTFLLGPAILVLSAVSFLALPFYVLLG
jgi:hypothetical protein